MSGILTIGIVLQDWFEKESLREAFKKLIKNPIIREVSIFRNAQKNPLIAIKLNNFRVSFVVFVPILTSLLIMKAAWCKDYMVKDLAHYQNLAIYVNFINPVKKIMHKK